MHGQVRIQHNKWLRLFQLKYEGEKEKKNHPGHELSMASDYMGFCWEVIQDPVTVYASIHVISVISVFIKERTQRRAQIASQPDASANQRDILCAMLESQWKRSGIPKRNATEKHRFTKKKTKQNTHNTTISARENPSQQAWLTDSNVYQKSRQVNNRAPFESDHRSSLQYTSQEPRWKRYPSVLFLFFPIRKAWPSGKG